MEIELLGLAKHYGRTVAVEDVSIALAKGEMLALLGPSGCGKTTTLRMIAGFVAPTRGRVRVQGRDVTDVPPRVSHQVMSQPTRPVMPNQKTV